MINLLLSKGIALWKYFGVSCGNNKVVSVFVFGGIAQEYKRLVKLGNGCS